MATAVDRPLIRRLATAPFDNWTYADVVREMRIEDSYHVRKRYAVEHDHYNRGKEWVGPGEPRGNDNIGKQFAPEDAVGSVLSNISNAFSEPQLGTAPLVGTTRGQEVSPEVKARMEEAKELLSEWWDDNRLQELITDRQETSAWAGTAGLRLRVPWRFINKVGDEMFLRSATNFRQALHYIRVTAPLPEHGRVLEDPATEDKVAVFMDTEIVYGANGRKTEYKRAELMYLDPDRETDEDADTILRVVYADERRPEVVTRLKLGGRLMFAQMNTKVVLTDPVIRTQRQLNLLTTLITRIVETSAFRERYTKNAKPQGTRVLYEEGDDLPNGAFLERDEEGRLWAVIPQERTLGANTTTELVGLPKYDERGDQKGYETPDIYIADPVDPKPYLEAIEATRRRLLRMCAQGHLGGISNAESSGIAYEQARAVFEKDLNRRRLAEEGMLRELLTAVLALAELIMGQQGYFTDVLRVTVDQHFNAGPRSPDLVRLDLEGYQAGVMAKSTIMTRFGIEDTVAEEERLEESPERLLELLEAINKAAGVNFDPGALKDLVQKVTGMSQLEDVQVKEPEPAPE